MDTGARLFLALMNCCHWEFHQIPFHWRIDCRIQGVNGTHHVTFPVISDMRVYIKLHVHVGLPSAVTTGSVLCCSVWVLIGCIMIYRIRMLALWWVTSRFLLLHLVKKKIKCSRYRPGVAQRVSRGIALLFHDRGTRRGWVVNSTPRQHFTPGKDAVPNLQESGWDTGPIWTPEILVPTGNRSRTFQPVAQSLYRLRYPPHLLHLVHSNKFRWKSLMETKCPHYFRSQSGNL